jgi:hypothetical protein
VDVVPLLEQQLGEVEAVLAGDPGDECGRHGRESASRDVPPSSRAGLALG